MLSFFGEQCLKDAVIERVKEHQRLDEIIQGTYWDGAKGCGIGCAIHSSDHMAFESLYQIPMFLAYMDEHIFERLPVKQAKRWPLRFFEAIPVGVDLELVFPRFMHWLLSDPDGMRKHANAQTLPIIDSLVNLYAARIDGIPFDAMAARAAETAAETAAWAAAGAAAGAAETAAWAAAGAAAGAAETAAWAAAGAAETAAWAAYINRQADYLIALLQSYESKPILVYAPCEEHKLVTQFYSAS